MSLLNAKGIVLCDELDIVGGEDIGHQRYVKGDVIPLNIYALYRDRLKGMQIIGAGIIEATFDEVRIRALNTCDSPPRLEMPFSPMPFSPMLMGLSMLLGGLLVGIWVVPRYWRD